MFDSVSTLAFGSTKAILKNKGIMINTLPTPRSMVTQLFNAFRSQKFKSIMNKPTAENITLLAQLVANKQLKVIIDRQYKLSELPQAHAYSETGKAKGKIIIKVN